MLGIEDLYTRFCIDEAAEYLCWKLKSNTKNQEDLKTMMKKYSTKKRKGNKYGI